MGILRHLPPSTASCQSANSFASTRNITSALLVRNTPARSNHSHSSPAHDTRQQDSSNANILRRAPPQHSPSVKPSCRAILRGPQKKNAETQKRWLECQAVSGSDGFTSPPSNVSQSPSSDDTYTMWDKTTNTLTACSTVANLFMMMPQILKNAGSLMAGRPAELAGLSWIAFSTGYLGNMLLLSYFTEQRQLSACLVQVVGAFSTLALLSQVWMAGFMPSPAFVAVCSFFLAGCVTNGLRYTDGLPQQAWELWQDFVGLLGLSVLPQVIWSSFSPHPTLVPGSLAFLSGVFCVYQIKSGSASKALVDTWQKLSGWTATLLFMFMPVAQLQACLANPANLGTMSPIFNILGLIGNGLMIPRALFTRDLIWFTGSTWGALMMGWGMLLALALFSYIPMPLLSVVTVVFFSFLGFVLVMNAKAHKLSSPLASILYLKP